MGNHTYFHIPVKQSKLNYRKSCISSNYTVLSLKNQSQHPNAIVIKEMVGDIEFSRSTVIITKELPTGVNEGEIPFIRCNGNHYDTIIKDIKSLKKYFKKYAAEGLKYIHLFEYAWKKYPTGFVFLS